MSRVHSISQELVKHQMNTNFVELNDNEIKLLNTLLQTRATYSNFLLDNCISDEEYKLAKLCYKHVNENIKKLLNLQ